MDPEDAGALLETVTLEDCTLDEYPLEDCTLDEYPLEDPLEEDPLDDELERLDPEEFASGHFGL